MIQKPITRPVLVYSNETVIRGDANLTNFIDNIMTEIDNQTECQHAVIKHEDNDGDTQYALMLDNYIIGGLTITEYRDMKGYYYQCCFTITVTDDIDSQDAVESVQDAFNPIFLEA